VAEEDASAAQLEALFTVQREAEWAEFVSDCGKYETELAGEVAKGKLTLAELDEEEQSLDRLRRWYRTIRARDLFGAQGRNDPGDLFPPPESQPRLGAAAGDCLTAIAGGIEPPRARHHRRLTQVLRPAASDPYPTVQADTENLAPSVETQSVPGHSATEWSWMI
jgi:hypothetical protein